MFTVLVGRGGAISAVAARVTVTSVSVFCWSEDEQSASAATINISATDVVVRSLGMD